MPLLLFFVEEEWLTQHAHLTLKEADDLLERSESFMSKQYKEFGVKRETQTGKYVRERVELPECYLKRVPGTRKPINPPKDGCRVCWARERCGMAVAANEPVLCEKIVYGPEGESV